MCKYKEGDVGIRRLESFNMALLEKWRWLLGEKDKHSLWKDRWWGELRMVLGETLILHLEVIMNPYDGES